MTWRVKLLLMMVVRTGNEYLDTVLTEKKTDLSDNQISMSCIG